MKIPNKIKVEGIEFKVLTLTDEEMNKVVGNEDKSGNSSLCGYTSFKDCIILINSSYNDDMKIQTIFHELVHICDSRMSPLDENQVDNIARRLYAVIKDNKLFDKLFDK
jgi:Zn-dependent peptidase ImmA (M78 family)